MGEGSAGSGSAGYSGSTASGSASGSVGGSVSGSASGSAGYLGVCADCSPYGAGYSGETACPGIKSMYGAAPVGIEARLTISPLTGDGVGYQPLMGSTPYLSAPSPEGYLARGSQEPYLQCQQCGSEVSYGAGSEMSSLAMSVLLKVIGDAMQEPGEDFYKKACLACMTGKGQHTCGR